MARPHGIPYAYARDAYPGMHSPLKGAGMRMRSLCIPTRSPPAARSGGRPGHRACGPRHAGAPSLTPPGPRSVVARAVDGMPPGPSMPGRTRPPRMPGRPVPLPRRCAHLARPCRVHAPRPGRPAPRCWRHAAPAPAARGHARPCAGGPPGGRGGAVAGMGGGWDIWVPLHAKPRPAFLSAYLCVYSTPLGLEPTDLDS
jgi:hypothetical protein